MRIKQRKFMMALLIPIMCLILFSPVVAAAEAKTGEIPVTINIGGFLPTIDEDYKIIMKADNPLYPMPEGSVDGVFSMTITGAGTGKLPEIEFFSLGVYTYKISQEAGSNELGTYDSTVYDLVVYVTNVENGSGLETTVLLYKLGETEKLESVRFYNEYEEEIIDIPDEEPPLGPIDIPDEETPIGPGKLPKTGSGPKDYFYIGGGLLVATGLLIKKKKGNTES